MSIFINLMAYGSVFPFAGRVPTLQEGNMKENVFCFPWLQDKSIVLGTCGNYCSFFSL